MKLVPMNSIFGIRCFYFFSFSFHLNLHLNCSINSDFFPFFLYFRNAEVELVFFFMVLKPYMIFFNRIPKNYQFFNYCTHLILFQDRIFNKER